MEIPKPSMVEVPSTLSKSITKHFVEGLHNRWAAVMHGWDSSGEYGVAVYNPPDPEERSYGKIIKRNFLKGTISLEDRFGVIEVPARYIHDMQYF